MGAKHGLFRESKASDNFVKVKPKQMNMERSQNLTFGI